MKDKEKFYYRKTIPLSSYSEVKYVLIKVTLLEVKNSCTPSTVHSIRESYKLLLSDNSAKFISTAYHSVLSLMAVSLIVVFSFQFRDFVFDVNQLKVKCVDHCAITKTDYE